jgi:hypothetical protein
MFVLTLPSKKMKWFCGLFLLGVCVCIVSALLIKNIDISSDENTVLSVNNNVSSNEQVLEFISNFGWEVANEPDEIREIVIPVEFDEVYKGYNEIQLSQGYDLTEYAGERVKRWTFTVLNYPGYENEEFIKINILICDNVVIGGDVCSIKLDGFMHGFVKE